MLNPEAAPCAEMSIDASHSLPLESSLDSTGAGGSDGGDCGGCGGGLDGGGGE